MELLFSDMKEAEGVVAVFVFGDFNEPSERDWTVAAYSCKS
jgi:exodeoxyribonuclease-3